MRSKSIGWRKKYLMASAGVLLTLTGVSPLVSWSQTSSESSQMGGAVQSATQPGLSIEDLEDRRQEIVVASMKFSNDQQKSKFLEIYVPYQEKLKAILLAKRKSISEFAQDEQNGVISSRDATRILNY